MPTQGPTRTGRVATMRVPTAGELLDVWEAGQALGPIERALALLMVSRPDLPDEALAEMPIGRRDAELLSLRERLFGPLVTALARCPRCGDRFELTFTVAEVRVTGPDDPALLVECDGYAVRARLANSVDLMDAQAARDAGAIERAVIARCTLEARRGDALVDVDELPASVVEAVADAMSAADPQADVQVDVGCSACGHRWPAVFDVAAFLWREVQAWAKRLLDEVHTLALTYGWSERDILAMSVSRRRRYVSLIAGDG